MVAHNAETYIKPIQTHAADSWSATTHNSSGVDCRGFRQALILLNVGTQVSGGTLTVTVEGSSDDGSADAYAAITGAAFTVVTPANDVAIRAVRLALRPQERYIRVKAVVATQAVEFSSSVLLFEHDDGGLQDFTYDASV